MFLFQTNQKPSEEEITEWYTSMSTVWSSIRQDLLQHKGNLVKLNDKKASTVDKCIKAVDEVLVVLKNKEKHEHLPKIENASKLIGGYIAYFKEAYPTGYVPNPDSQLEEQTSPLPEDDVIVGINWTSADRPTTTQDIMDYTPYGGTANLGIKSALYFIDGRIIPGATYAGATLLSGYLDYVMTAGAVVSYGGTLVVDAGIRSSLKSSIKSLTLKDSWPWLGKFFSREVGEEVVEKQVMKTGTRLTSSETGQFVDNWVNKYVIKETTENLVEKEIGSTFGAPTNIAKKFLNAKLPPEEAAKKYCMAWIKKNISKDGQKILFKKGFWDDITEYCSTTIKKGWEKVTELEAKQIMKDYTAKNLVSNGKEMLNKELITNELTEKAALDRFSGLFTKKGKESLFREGAFEFESSPVVKLGVGFKKWWMNWADDVINSTKDMAELQSVRVKGIGTTINDGIVDREIRRYVTKDMGRMESVGRTGLPGGGLYLLGKLMKGIYYSVDFALVKPVLGYGKLYANIDMGAYITSMYLKKKFTPNTTEMIDLIVNPPTKLSNIELPKDLKEDEFFKDIQTQVEEEEPGETLKFDGSTEQSLDEDQSTENVSGQEQEETTGTLTWWDAAKTQAKDKGVKKIMGFIDQLPEKDRPTVLNWLSQKAGATEAAKIIGYIKNNMDLSIKDLASFKKYLKERKSLPISKLTSKKRRKLVT